MTNESSPVNSPILTAIYRPRQELLLFCLLFACVRLPWLFMVPMAQAPDEFAHYWVAHFLQQHLSLPLDSDVAAGGALSVYGPLPQIGYIPHALLSAIIPFWDPSVTARLGSFLMGIVLLYASYALGHELHPKNPLAAMSLPLIIIFHPQLVLVHSYVNNDSTAAALAGLIMLFCVRMLKQGVTLTRCILTGVLCGLLILSKYSGLAIIFGALFGVAAASLLDGGSIIGLCAGCGTVLSAMALVSSWWFVREWYQFTGDLLGTQSMRRYWAKIYNMPVVYHENIWHIIKDGVWWRTLFYSYWGAYGYMKLFLWRPFYVGYLLYVLSALSGGLSFFWKNAASLGKIIILRLKVGNAEDVPEDDDQQLREVIAYSMFAICIAVETAAMLWASSQNLGGAQGRYLFPCELPIVALLVAGIFCLPKKAAKLTMCSFLLFNAIVYLWSSVTLFQLYGGFRTKTF